MDSRFYMAHITYYVPAACRSGLVSGSAQASCAAPTRQYLDACCGLVSFSRLLRCPLRHVSARRRRGGLCAFTTRRGRLEKSRADLAELLPLDSAVIVPIEQLPQR